MVTKTGSHLTLSTLLESLSIKVIHFEEMENLKTKQQITAGKKGNHKNSNLLIMKTNLRLSIMTSYYLRQEATQKQKTVLAPESTSC